MNALIVKQKKMGTVVKGAPNRSLLFDQPSSHRAVGMLSFFLTRRSGGTIVKAAIPWI